MQFIYLQFANRVYSMVSKGFYYFIPKPLYIYLNRFRLNIEALFKRLCSETWNFRFEIGTDVDVMICLKLIFTKYELTCSINMILNSEILGMLPSLNAKYNDFHAGKYLSIESSSETFLIDGYL